MKYYLIIACISFLTLTNCSLDSVNNTSNQVIRVFWHLKNVSGGTDDVDIDFPANKIIWEFEETNLKVNNTNTDTDLEDGPDTGNYPYSTFKVDDKEYLKVNSIEVGRVTFNSDGTQLTLNQNETSEGTGEDGYIYTFEKTVTVTN